MWSRVVKTASSSTAACALLIPSQGLCVSTWTIFPKNRGRISSSMTRSIFNSQCETHSASRPPLMFVVATVGQVLRPVTQPANTRTSSV